MSSKPRDPATSMQKLGKLLREGALKAHPANEQNQQLFRETIRAQHEQSRSAQRGMNAPAPGKDQKPPQMGLEP